MLELISEHACFGGVQRFYRHPAAAIGLPMRFSVFMPPAPKTALPALFYLAGLTCTEETFAIKAGAQRVAAELGLMLIAPDTSPRGANIAGETDDWDFGAGAGFYVDATEAPWHTRYRMYSYVLELRALVVAELGADEARIGICGHSMGGHGALMLALRNPTLFRSVSAFAPIAAPMRCPWGEKAFAGYLGQDRSQWADYDASALMETQHMPFAQGILIDQGLGDKFLATQLYPDVFEAACAKAEQPLTLRRHAGYDHGYYFIASFIEDHLRFHRRNLTRSSAVWRRVLARAPPVSARTLVLALPRGGVPVGYALAKTLGLPLDVLLVRKLGLPGHEEFAMGAVGTDGVQVVNADVVQAFHVAPELVASASAREWQRIAAGEDLYRLGRAQPELPGRPVIVVDDGMATGASMRSAIAVVRAQGAAPLTVAVPVAAPHTCAAIRREGGPTGLSQHAANIWRRQCLVPALQPDGRRSSAAFAVAGLARAGTACLNSQPTPPQTP